MQTSKLVALAKARLTGKVDLELVFGSWEAGRFKPSPASFTNVQLDLVGWAPIGVVTVRCEIKIPAVETAVYTYVALRQPGSRKWYSRGFAASRYVQQGDILALTIDNFSLYFTFRRSRSMRLYQTTNTANGDTEWHGTQSEASKCRAAITASSGHRTGETAEIDVPTNKAELLAWLNKNKIRVAP